MILSLGQRAQRELQKEPLHPSSASNASPANEESCCLMRELINTYGCYSLIRRHTHTESYKPADAHLGAILKQRKVAGRRVVRGVCDGVILKNLNSVRNVILLLHKWPYYCGTVCANAAALACFHTEVEDLPGFNCLHDTTRRRTPCRPLLCHMKRCSAEGT